MMYEVMNGTDPLGNDWRLVIRIGGVNVQGDGGSVRSSKSIVGRQ